MVLTFNRYNNMMQGENLGLLVPTTKCVRKSYFFSFTQSFNERYKIILLDEKLTTQYFTIFSLNLDANNCINYSVKLFI
jgi:hypothetical protein